MLKRRFIDSLVNSPARMTYQVGAAKLLDGFPYSKPLLLLYIPYGSKYLLRKCLGYDLGVSRTFSDHVWIHRDCYHLC
jgi:hypothetical protein